MLKLKPHVLRYWEKEIPLLSPRKTVSGHREYSPSDLEVIYRIRHLLYNRGYTLAGVRSKLWEESSAAYQDAKAEIATLRAELISVTERLSYSRRRLEKIESIAAHLRRPAKE